MYSKIHPMDVEFVRILFCMEYIYIQEFLY